MQRLMRLTLWYAPPVTGRQICEQLPLNGCGKNALHLKFAGQYGFAGRLSYLTINPRRPEAPAAVFQINSHAICASFARSAAYSAMRVCALRSASGACPGTPKTG